MKTAVIEMSGIRKRYDYQDEVLRGVDFSVEAGTIMGLVGKNGAGKTTLIKVMLGLIRPGSGESSILGEPSLDMSADVRHRIGYVPQKMVGYGWMTAGQLLKFTGSFYHTWDEERVSQLMREWDLSPKARVRNLSEGQRQKLTVIQALGHEPDLLILDEPVASLDPVARRQFIRELIQLNIDAGKTVLFSTHIMSDLERVAADITLLRNGVVNYIGDLSNLKEQVCRLRIQADNDLPQRLPIKNLVHSRVDKNTAVVTVRDCRDSDIERLEQELSARITVESLNLEDIFVELNR